MAFGIVFKTMLGVGGVITFHNCIQNINLEDTQPQEDHACIMFSQEHCRVTAWFSK